LLRLYNAPFRPPLFHDRFVPLIRLALGRAERQRFTPIFILEKHFTDSPPARDVLRSSVAILVIWYTVPIFIIIHPTVVDIDGDFIFVMLCGRRRHCVQKEARETLP